MKTTLIPVLTPNNQHYKRLATKVNVNTTCDFLCEFIHYNKNIVRGRHVVFVQEWYNAGILQINDLMNNDGSFLSFVDFKLKYSNLHTDFLLYNGILCAIKEYQQRIDFDCTACNVLVPNENITWSLIKKGNKNVQAALKDSVAEPTSLLTWNAMYLDLDWKNIFTKSFVTTQDTQLRWFQFRLLHRILPTRRYLNVRKLADSPTCNLCNRYIQTVKHLFWGCEPVNTFWKDFSAALHAKCPHTERFEFREELVLFGLAPNIVTDTPIDYMILLAKFFIYKCMLSTALPTYVNYLYFLKVKYDTEKCLASLTNCQMEFYTKWLLYLPLFV